MLTVLNMSLFKHEFGV